MHLLGEVRIGEASIAHYCVANMPGAVARTSTFALNNASLPFALALADKGWKKALVDDKHLHAGLNVHEGKVTYAAVAEAHGLPYTSAESILGLLFIVSGIVSMPEQPCLIHPSCLKENVKFLLQFLIYSIIITISCKDYDYVERMECCDNFARVKGRYKPRKLYNRDSGAAGGGSRIAKETHRP